MADEALETVVLVVEDDPAVRSLLHDALADVGYKVLLADTSDAALSTLATVQPDLITVDLNLPGIGGVQLLRTIRQRSELQQVPVVIVSSERDVAPAVRELAQAVVEKPFHLPDLMAAIGSLVPPPSLAAAEEQND